MAIPTFTPPKPPSPGTERKPELKIKTTEFGDGYTQETADGLNHIRRTISLTWETLTPTERNTIDSFMTERGGYLPFYYTPSDESTPVKWTCKEWGDRSGKMGFKTFSATFKQYFGLEL